MRAAAREATIASPGTLRKLNLDLPTAKLECHRKLSAVALEIRNRPPKNWLDIASYTGDPEKIAKERRQQTEDHIRTFAYEICDDGNLSNYTEGQYDAVYKQFSKIHNTLKPKSPQRLKLAILLMEQLIIALEEATETTT